MTLTYPRDIFGDRTGIWDDRPSQNWLGWDIFWSRVAGQRLNMGGASAFIDHADATGSTVMETGPAGVVQWDVVNGPWGQVLAQGGTRQSQVFAGMDWQVNDPLIPSATREYSDGLGRWMTPDPGGTKVVSLANPQTWNMYAYVTDNPTTLNDPSGLAACSYTSLSACFEVLNNPHASASEENSSHDSAYPANSKQKNTVKAGAPRTPIKGPPNTKVKYPNGTEREFGPDGNAVKDIDTRGHPHDPEPHAHDWDHSGPKPRRGGRRDLTPEEKRAIENATAKAIIVSGAGALIQTIIQTAPDLLPLLF